MRVDSQGSGDTILDSGRIAEILASIGEVPYEWDIRNDLLAVGRCCGPIRQSARRGAAARTPTTVALFCDGNTQSRRDVVLRSDERDGGEGVLYRIRHRAPADGKTKPV
jgi:hypothetical protein